MDPIVEPEIERYVRDHTTPDPPLLAAVAEETRAETDAAEMMVGPVEARFLETLVALCGARRVLEIGTFTGYSALAMASALPPGGRLVTCEIDGGRAATARRHLDASPWADRVEVRVGPALETLAGLEGPFDLVFVDADKGSYLQYFESALPLLSERGVMVVDNVLWSGRVLDPETDDADTRAIVEFNAHVRRDPRVVAVMLTVRDGVTLIRRAPGASAKAAGSER